MADGHLNKCKTCTKSAVASHRLANLEAIKDYDRNRPNKGERNEAVKLRHKIGMADPVYRERIQQTKQEWIERNPEKRAAHTVVSNALRDGKLIKQTCDVCCEVEVEAHHDDYTKPLEVRWLCTKHHAEHHKTERELD